MNIEAFSLVEFHDIDIFEIIMYNNNIGVPRLEENMIITFVGHSSISNHNDVYQKIKQTIIENTSNDEKTSFYCGGYGDYDNLCAKACKSLKEDELHCEVIFITPYITESQQEKIKNMLDSKIYDASIYPPLESVPPKFAISKRNEWMINESELVVAYVKHTNGGAYKALEFARRKKKRIINLAE